jgi:hypothetical protein
VLGGFSVHLSHANRSTVGIARQEPEDGVRGWMFEPGLSNRPRRVAATGAESENSISELFHFSTG